MELAKELYDPIDRTSTPIFGKSSSTGEDPFYANFSSKLKAPLKKGTIRGIYGPKNGVINGHFAMRKREHRPADYTCVMMFPKEFAITYNFNRAEESIVHQNDDFSKYKPSEVNYPGCQQRNIEVAPQLHPMFFLPVKYS